VARALILALVSAFSAPQPASASFGEFTIRDELELARKFDLYIETRFPVIHDTRVTGYVQSLVDRLVAAMPPQPFPIKVTVVRNGAMNAFASAAGHITIFSGLLANLASEDELASVIAHELAHVSERHIAESIEKNQLVGAGSLLGILAAVLVGSQGGGKGADALVLGSVAGARAMQLKYTRENEKDADQFGLNYLVDAGFSPSGMVDAFDKMRKMQWLAGGGDVPSYLSTHPGLDDRLGYMQERVARLPEEVRKRRSDNTRFVLAKLLVQAWFTDPASALAFFSQRQGAFVPDRPGRGHRPEPPAPDRARPRAVRQGPGLQPARRPLAARVRSFRLRLRGSRGFRPGLAGSRAEGPRRPLRPFFLRPGHGRAGPARGQRHGHGAGAQGRPARLGGPGKPGPLPGRPGPEFRGAPELRQGLCLQAAVQQVFLPHAEERGPGDDAAGEGKACQAREEISEFREILGI
jgi:Zn-dependent protease with chaperone function